jgi:hypothetical protein
MIRKNITIGWKTNEEKLEIVCTLNCYFSFDDYVCGVFKKEGQ